VAEGKSGPVELHLREEGTGPAVLLLHGLGGDHTVWNEVIRPLAADHRVLAPDLRGHGRSAAPVDATYSFAEMQADVLHLLETKELSKVHLVGLSAGGFLSLQMALSAPERLRSLVTIGAASHCDAHTRAMGERWAETLKDQGFDAYVLRLLKDLYYPDWVEAHVEYVDRLRSSLRREDQRGAVAWGLAVRSFDLRGRTGRIRLPTFVIHGVDDQVVDSAHARLLRVSIPGAQLRLFPQTGHLVPVERPAETVTAIREWVARAETPTSSGA
jgi:3-oxoadipate enol-lactonase